jgi:hypothetical protein
VGAVAEAGYFENWCRNHCGAALGFLPDALQLVALEKDVAGSQAGRPGTR